MKYKCTLCGKEQTFDSRDMAILSGWSGYQVGKNKQLVHCPYHTIEEKMKAVRDSLKQYADEWLAENKKWVKK